MGKIHDAKSGVTPARRSPTRATFLRYKDHRDTDCVVGSACPRVPGRKRYSVLLCGQRHQRVVNRPAGDAETAQRVVHPNDVKRDSGCLGNGAGGEAGPGCYEPCLGLAVVNVVVDDERDEHVGVKQDGRHLFVRTCDGEPVGKDLE